MSKLSQLELARILGINEAIEQEEEREQKKAEMLAKLRENLQATTIDLHERHEQMRQLQLSQEEDVECERGITIVNVDEALKELSKAMNNSNVTQHLARIAASSEQAAENLRKAAKQLNMSLPEIVVIDSMPRCRGKTVLPELFQEIIANKHAQTRQGKGDRKKASREWRKQWRC